MAVSVLVSKVTAIGRKHTGEYMVWFTVCSRGGWRATRPRNSSDGGSIVKAKSTIRERSVSPIMFFGANSGTMDAVVLGRNISKETGGGGGAYICQCLTVVVAEPFRKASLIKAWWTFVFQVFLTLDLAAGCILYDIM